MAKIEKCYFIQLLLSLFLFSSCSTILRNQVNKKFPEVSPTARKIQNLVKSSFELSQIDTVSFGIHLGNESIEKMLLSEIKKLRVFKISDVDSIVLDTNTVKIVFQNQGISLSSKVAVFVSPSSSNLKILKSFEFEFSGFISPYFSNSIKELEDTINWNPNIENLKIQKIKFRKSPILNSVSGLATYIANYLTKEFINNINGLIPELKTPLKLAISEEKKYSELINPATSDLVIEHDDVILLNKKIGRKALLIEPTGLNILGKIENIPAININMKKRSVSALSFEVNRILGASSLFSSSTAKTEEELRKKEFNSQFSDYKMRFFENWNMGLDTLKSTGGQQNSVHISQSFIAGFINEIFYSPRFSVKTKLKEESGPIARTTLELFKKPEFDCNKLPRPDCGLPDCRNVLSDCGSCGRWNIPCKIRKGACEVYNGIKYAACLSYSAAKRVACEVYYGGQIAWCLTKYAVFTRAYYATKIGDVWGDVTGRYQFDAALKNIHISPDFSNFNISVSGAGKGSVDVKINYHKDILTELGSFLKCECMPPIFTTCEYEFKGINADFKIPPNLTGRLNKIVASTGKAEGLEIEIDKVKIPLQFEKSPYEYLINNVEFTLGCQLYMTALTLWKITDKIWNFKGKVKEYADAAFRGIYNYELDAQKFKFKLAPVTFEMPATTQLVVLTPRWGIKSMIYE